jgi:hypothetical protein
LRTAGTRGGFLPCHVLRCRSDGQGETLPCNTVNSCFLRKHFRDGQGRIAFRPCRAEQRSARAERCSALQPWVAGSRPRCAARPHLASTALSPRSGRRAVAHGEAVGPQAAESSEPQRADVRAARVNPRPSLCPDVAPPGLGLLSVRFSHGWRRGLQDVARFAGYPPRRNFFSFLLTSIDFHRSFFISTPPRPVPADHFPDNPAASSSLNRE